MDAFWQAFRRHARLDHDNYVVDRLATARGWRPSWAIWQSQGLKRATASLARDYGGGREPMPTLVDFVMILDGEGHPRFIWRTTTSLSTVRHRPT